MQKLGGKMVCLYVIVSQVNKEVFIKNFEKKYNLSEKRENLLEDGKIVIFPKEYFYPYGFHEKYTDDCIKSETYGIH